MHGCEEKLAVPSGMQCVFLALLAVVSLCVHGPHHPVVAPFSAWSK